MPYSCLSYMGQLPTVDVVEICARDTAGQAAFRLHGVVADVLVLGPTGASMLAGAVLAGAILALRALVFLWAVGRAARRGWMALSRGHRRPAARTLVERHRGRPAEVAPGRPDPS